MPGRTATGDNPSEGRGAAGLDGSQQAFHVFGTGPGWEDAVLLPHLGNGPAEEAAPQFPREAGGIDSPFAALAGDAILCQLIRGPIQCVSGLAKRCRRTCQAARLELRVIGQEAADGRAVEARIVI